MIASEVLGVDAEDIEAQKAAIRKQAEEAGNKLIATAKSESEKLISKASNPLAKVAAQAAGKKLVEEAEKQERGREIDRETIWWVGIRKFRLKEKGRRDSISSPLFVERRGEAFCKLEILFQSAGTLSDNSHQICSYKFIDYLGRR